MYFRINLFLLSALFAIICQAFGEMIPLTQGQHLLRNKRDHGVAGPVHTFVKTDKHANFKWGVRHHVGHHYSG